MPSLNMQIPDDAGVQPAQGLQVHGKFGAPPSSPEEEGTFASEWEGFFNKLKTDQNMQQALLNFSANVTSGEHNGTVNAIAASTADAVGGYRKANEADADKLAKIAMNKQTHDAEIAKSWSEIAKNHGLTEEAGAHTTDLKASANRTNNAVDLDASTAELNRARAAEALATAKNGGKGKKGPDKVDKIAAALLAKGIAHDENDAYLQATELAKSPALSKIAADYINSQGFLHEKDLPEATQRAVNTAVGAGKGVGAGSGQGVPIPMAGTDMSNLRKMLDTYTGSRGKPPVSDAKLLEISKNPAMIAQLKASVVPTDSASTDDGEDDGTE